MGLKLVIERECSRDHQTALRQFLCCEPGGPEWAMDPQRYIRDLSVRKTPKGIMRTLLVVSGDIPLHDDVVGFCEYGVAVETTDEHEGVYQISYIATALKVRGTHLGDTLLSSVIVRLRDDAWRFNRTPLVLTQVDPRNKPSMDLFTIRIHGRGAGSRRPGIPSAVPGVYPAGARKLLRQHTRVLLTFRV